MSYPNMMPPAPPPPPNMHHMHLPPGQFHHGPHGMPPNEHNIIEILPPGAGKFDDITDEGANFVRKLDNMRLDNRDMEKGRGFPEHGKGSKILPKLDSSASSTFLEGWTFYRADPDNDSERPNWSRATKTRMKLSQTELTKMVQKRKKKMAPSEQYGALKKFKRSHVDQLIEKVEKEDHRFQWTCVYVDTTDQDVKGKGSRRGDYETISMDVIIQRKLRPEYAAEASSIVNKKTAFGELVDLNLPINSKLSKGNKMFEPESRGVADIPGINAQINRSLAQRSFPPNMVHPGPQPFHQPSLEHIGGPQRPMMGNGFPLGPLPVNPHPPLPQMVNGPFNGPGGPRGGNDIEVIGEEIQFPPNHMPGQGPELIHDFHDKPPRDFVNANNRQPHHPQGQPRVLQLEPRSRSPRDRQSPQYTPSSSSVEDDDASLLFDRDEDSSTTEDLYDDALDGGPDRGSLHHNRKSRRRQRERSNYRSHYRKPMKAIGDRRHRYSTSPVDLYPENSLHASRREPLTRRLTDIADRVRPRVIYDERHELRDPTLAAAGDIAYLSAKLREQQRERELEKERELRDRAQLENLRARIIDAKEDDLRRRERELSFREKEIRDVRILDRDHSRLLDRDPRSLDRDHARLLDRDPRILDRDSHLLDHDSRLLDRDSHLLDRDPRLLGRRYSLREPMRHELRYNPRSQVPLLDDY